MGLWQTSKNLASLWAEHKKLQLQNRGKPNTKVDSGGTVDKYSFEGQEVDREQLREVKQIRESGGVISHLVHAKALMQFGTGASFQAENDAAAEWLADQFGDLDNLLIDIGEDATWFPFAIGEIVETMGGEFSHLELVEPWTIQPITDEYGDIIAWEQEIKSGRETEVYEPDEIASFILNKSSGRDKTGISEVLRSKDEIQAYRENSQAINNAVQLHAYPQRHVAVGREGGTVIEDNELRRVRNMFNDWDEDTVWVTGRDVDIEPIEAENFDFETVTQHDLRKLCVALGVPIELASVISEGLGSGEQSSARQVFFELEKQAKQRALGGQFVEQVARVLLEKYSTFDADQELDLVFDDYVTAEESKTMIDAIGDDLTVNERRELFDRAPLDDDDVGEDFESPGSGSSGNDDGLGGFFSEKELSGEHWDDYFLEMHHRIWADDTDKQLVQFGGDSEVPQFVKNRLRDAILSGSVFSDIESIPSDQRMQLQNFLIEQLEDDNWSIDGIANRLQDLEADLSADQAEVIARTETASAVNSAREQGYKERGEDDHTFKWVGQVDGRTTEACQWLLEQTNPDYGGEPVGLEELKELIAEAPSHDPEMDDNIARPEDYVVHPNERKTFVRHVE